MLKTKLDELKGLIKLLDPDEVYKLKQYIWWDTYNFIESIHLDCDIESDDEGGSYKCYWLYKIKIKDTKKLIDFCIKRQGADLIDDLFNTKYYSRENVILDIDNIYKLAEPILGNEDNYCLKEILEDNAELSIFYEQNDYKITTNPGNSEINLFINNFIKELKIIVDKYDN